MKPQMNLNLKALLPTVLMLTAFSNSNLYAAETVQNENIEVRSQTEPTTKEELATIYVLSEICPKIVGKNDTKAFEQGYARLAKDYWPNKSDAVQGLNKLAQQDQFKSYLLQARSNAKNATVEDNRDVCKDVIAYQ